jgi:hypothetical protein
MFPYFTPQPRAMKFSEYRTRRRLVADVLSMPAEGTEALVSVPPAAPEETTVTKFSPRRQECPTGQGECSSWQILRGHGTGIGRSSHQDDGTEHPSGTRRNIRDTPKTDAASTTVVLSGRHGYDEFPDLAPPPRLRDKLRQSWRPRLDGPVQAGPRWRSQAQAVSWLPNPSPRSSPRALTPFSRPVTAHIARNHS